MLSKENVLSEFGYINTASCMANCLQCLNGYNSCTKCTEGADCCNKACTKCENQITCKSCQTGFRLDQKLNICVSQYSCEGTLCMYCDNLNQSCIECISEYYLNKEMLICEQCAPNCEICISPDNCTLCDSIYYLENGICLRCQQNCMDCRNGTSCEVCEQSYYIDISGKCEKCMDNCAKCTTENFCQQCNRKFYFDADTSKCLPCSYKCQQCKNSNQCLECESHYFLNKTLKSCQTCEQFYPHCLDCQYTNLQTFNAKPTVICMKCEPRYYVSKFQCENCPQNCAQCDFKNQCQNCTKNYFLNDSKLCQECKILFCMICKNKNECFICQSGYYWSNDISNLQCLKCPYGCKQCDKFSCNVCANGFYSKNGNCYRCDTGCYSCRSDPVDCSICMPGYFKVQFSWGRCLKCAQPCLQCKNITQCTKCIYGFYLENAVCKKCEIQGCDQCIFTDIMNNAIGEFNQTLELSHNASTKICVRCSINYFSINSTCEKCIEGCSLCQTLKVCIECYRGYWRNKQGTKCTKCPQHCLSCSVNPFNSEVLMMQCQQGYTRNQKHNKCVPCIEHCKLCPQHNINNFCLDCQEGYYRALNSNESTQQCLPCKAPCKTCSSLTECSSCVIGYYMNSKDECKKCGQGCEQCQSEFCFICAQGYRLDVVSLKCDKCKVENCLSCKSSLEKCDNCDNGYKYFEVPTNVSTLKHIQDSLSPLCYRCDESIEGCKSCSSPFLCTQCFSGLELMDQSKNDDVKNSCILSDKQSSQVLYFAIIGVQSLLCLILIVCIVMTRRKIPKTLNKKIVKANEIETLIQTSQQTISPIDTVISSIASHGKKSSVFNSFTGIN